MEGTTEAPEARLKTSLRPRVVLDALHPSYRTWTYQSREEGTSSRGALGTRGRVSKYMQLFVERRLPVEWEIVLLHVHLTLGPAFHGIEREALFLAVLVAPLAGAGSCPPHEADWLSACWRAKS